MRVTHIKGMTQIQATDPGEGNQGRPVEFLCPEGRLSRPPGLILEFEPPPLPRVRDAGFPVTKKIPPLRARGHQSFGGHFKPHPVETRKPQTQNPVMPPGVASGEQSLTSTLRKTHLKARPSKRREVRTRNQRISAFCLDTIEWP